MRTSDADSHSGTTVNLPSDWQGDTQHAGVWHAETRTCDSESRVWCVQDDNGYRVFLPVGLRQ